jgi:hypothetical protein
METITLSDGTTVEYRAGHNWPWRRVGRGLSGEAKDLAGILPANTYTDADEAACFDLLTRATEAL